MVTREDILHELFLNLKKAGEIHLSHALSVVMAAESVGAEDQLAKILSTFVNEISPDGTYPDGIPLEFFIYAW